MAERTQPEERKGKTATITWKIQKITVGTIKISLGEWEEEDRSTTKSVRGRMHAMMRQRKRGAVIEDKKWSSVRVSCRK